MSNKDRRSGFKIKSDLTRALVLAQAGKCEEALPLAEQLAGELKTSAGFKLLVHCLESLGRSEQLAAALDRAVEAFPEDADLTVRAALSLYARDDYAGAARLFARAPKGPLEDEPEVLARHAHALLAIGKTAEALEPARRAFARKPRGVPALVLGLARLDSGELQDAEEALGRAAHSLDGPERDFSEGMLALTAFWQGDTDRARELWKVLDNRAALAPHLLSYLAIAEAAHGDGEAARAALSRSPDPQETTALLARARVELALGKPEVALTALGQIGEVPEATRALLDATRGRALRLSGRFADARAVLEPLSGRLTGPMGAMALVDLARMDSDEGRHEQAAARFEKALAIDPHSTEASQGQAMAKERIAWRDGVAKDARTQVEAARAEAEAMRRAFAEREREIEMLRARLAQTQREATEAEKAAARARAEAEHSRTEGVRQELAARELEAADRATEILREAFGASLDACPAGLVDALRVAETTYQKALYTELHPAAIAVLFAGALERGLYLLLVRPFDQSLSAEARAAFLKGATREIRPGRTEYLERFVEAFDRKARAPSLGEVARAIARRREAHLSAFATFLGEGHDPFLDALAAFVERASAQLRNPAVHGRALQMPQAELTRFRKELLFDLAGTGQGALPGLVRARSR